MLYKYSVGSGNLQRLLAKSLARIKHLSLPMAMCLLLGACGTNLPNRLDQFVETSDWRLVGTIQATDNALSVVSNGKNILINGETKNKAPYLQTLESYRDISMTMEFMIPGGSNSGVYFMGRYEIQIFDSFGKKEWDATDLGALYQRWDKKRQPRGYDGVPAKVNAAKPAGEWQKMEVIFRAPRFSEDGTKLSHAEFVSVLINDQLVQKNVVAKGPTRSAMFNNEAATGPLVLQGDHGPIAIRSLKIESVNLDDSPTRPLKKSEMVPLDAQGQPMVDLVAIGRRAFAKKGCNVCHTNDNEPNQNRSGPSLFGLLTEPVRKRAVLDSAEQHRIDVFADEDYIRSSVRDSGRYQAINNANQDSPYPPIMPSYSLELLSDFELDGLVAYIKTINPRGQQGPKNAWVSKAQEKYVLSEDEFAIWVKKEPRLSRVDIGAKHSGRAYHVGLPGGKNYSFDPRTLGIVDIWTGPFLGLQNEKDGRGNKASTHGVDAKVWPSDQQHLFQPLYFDGIAVDFSFKEPASINKSMGQAMVAYDGDYLRDVRALKARFLGVSTPKGAEPSFRYEVNENQVELQFVPREGRVEATFKMTLKTPQSFLFPEPLLSEIKVTDGQIKQGKWILPAGEYAKIVFEAKVEGAFAKAFVDEAIPDDSLAAQALTWEASEHAVDLLPGYSLSDGGTPLDRFGRQQLFEPMGIDFLNEDTVFVSTRTAGIWKIVDGKWYLFAEGVFESLGVVAESKNSVVIGEKPGLTRLIDANGDHWSERRENISDQFRFSSNYHEYLHGPVRYGDSYLYNLNLSHNAPGGYKSGGRFMDTLGGFRGWLIEIDSSGKFTPFASGFRSPAGLAISPAGEIIYTENQGEFVGTSKIFKVKRDKFYGNPTGLIDIPGMNNHSPEVQWDAVKDSRERPLILLPHNQVMNSPGHPVWDSTNGKFGPFADQMFLGDQTQSNIYRVDIEQVNGVEQGVVLPFADNLSSGVMRMAFNPADNSLWVGQTGRGWTARGGKISALQRIRWEGKEGEIPDAIQTVKVTSNGFEIVFTKPQQNEACNGVKVSSWHYRDTPNYGSPELGLREEILNTYVWSKDRRRCAIELKDFEVSERIAENTSRVYRIDMADTDFGQTHSAFHSKAFYTLHMRPE